MHDVYRRDGCSCTPTFGHFGLYFLGWVFLHTQTHFVGSWYTSLVKRGFPVHFLVPCGQSLHRSGFFAVEEYQTAHRLAFTVQYVVASLIYGPACFSHSPLLQGLLLRLPVKHTLGVLCIQPATHSRVSQCGVCWCSPYQGFPSTVRAHSPGMASGGLYMSTDRDPTHIHAPLVSFHCIARSLPDTLL